MLYPAIDLKEGRAVRLRQGKLSDETLYYPDPAEAARRWVAAGARRLHVVDLDGAFGGRSQNLAAVAAIRAAAAGVPLQLGGGLRSLTAIAAALEAGAARVILGTGALAGDLVARAVDRFGAERVVVGIDARDGWVATDGWVKVSQMRATDLAARLAGLGIADIIYTDILRDGMLDGPNFAAIAEMAAASPAGVIASGGIASLDDLRRLMQTPGVSGAILGKSIYEGRIDLAEALQLTREA